MYNSTRKICSALLTPSIKNVNDGQLPNSLQQLSMKVQEQCLMIQDTPCRKWIFISTLYSFCDL